MSQLGSRDYQITVLNTTCSIWYQKKTGITLHDTHTRNWQQFSGTSFWYVCHWGHSSLLARQVRPCLAVLFRRPCI